MSRKAVTIFLAAIACASVLLVVFLNTLIDRNRERIREEIEKNLGRSFKFGELRLSLWGGIGLLAKDLSIAEDPRFAATPFIQTKELRMQLRWLPLFVGDIEIKKFILDEPEIQVIKNEEGTLNISALSGPEQRARDARKETRDAKETKKRSALSLLVSAVYVTNGKIDYIDRSLKEPVEIRIRNVKMDLQGLMLSGKTKVKLSANLFEGQGQSMSVEGLVGPFRRGSDWTQNPLDLQVHFDSLLLSQLTRAIPFLRERVSPYLRFTGPLTLQAKLLGTIERPRISNLSITGALFGATKNNAVAKGELDFSKSGSWKDVEIKAAIALDAVSLDNLKKTPLLKQTLPLSLTSEGPLSLTSEIQGSIENLTAHTVIKAGESEIRYGGWLQKARGIPAELQVKVGRRQDRLVIEDSVLTLNNLKVNFAGWIEDLPERRLTLQLRSNGMDLAGWDKLLQPLSSYNTAGTIRWDLLIKKNLGLQGGGLEIRGTLSLDEIQAKDRKSGGGIEKITAQVSFRGKEARIEKGESKWEGIPLSNLKGDLAWLPNGMSFRNLSFQALGGTFRANGAWEAGAGNSLRLTLDPQIEAVEVKSLLSHSFPAFKDHIEGQLSLKARLQGASGAGSTLYESLQGEGASQIRAGSLKDFNLIERVLTRVTALPGISSLISSRIPPRYSALFQRRDTPFDTLAATFTIGQGRIHTENLLLATPEYSINGAGWIGFDKTTKWNATLVMSQQFTQDLMQEHRNVRYMLDRQGRLSVPFRLEGTIPHVQAKPDLQGLAEAIQRGMVQRGVERALGGEKDQRGKEKRDWIQKGLEQLFGK